MFDVAEGLDEPSDELPFLSPFADPRFRLANGLPEGPRTPLRAFDRSVLPKLARSFPRPALELLPGLPEPTVFQPLLVAAEVD